MHKYSYKVFITIFSQISISLIISVFVLALATYFNHSSVSEINREKYKETDVFVKTENNNEVRVLAETDSRSIEFSRDLEFVGDKFAARDITIGGEAAMEMVDDAKNKPIILSKIKGSVYKSDEKVDYYASWHSNKPTLSKIKYKTEEEREYQEIDEENFGQLHVLVLPSLDYSSVYEYKIESRDRWGTVSESEVFIFYSGDPEASFFDILENSFIEVFGWMKIK